MSANSPSDHEATEPSRWKEWRARNEWLSWDLYAGLLATGLVLGCSLRIPAIRGSGSSALFAVMGGGLAIAGLVFAGLAVLVALISEEYLAVLRADHRGLDSTWWPYVIVAVVALAAAGTALIASVLWSGLGEVGQAIGLSLPVGLLVWALFGTGQLVVITKFHGEMRAELLSHRVRAKALLLRRKEERDKSA